MCETYCSYFRSEIDAMSGYVPGEQPKVPNILKLNTNENPYPPSPGVMKTLREFDYERLRLYPDPLAEEVRRTIAEQFGLKLENVIAGNGSDDILNITVRCFADQNHPIACLTPSYSLYPTLAGLQGAPVKAIKLGDGFTLPKDLLQQAEGANLLMIARPNAPTGNSFPKSEMEKICAGFKGIVLIDEAYADFAENTCEDFLNKYPNVIISRTFSKSRSLAGLRFGFALAHRNIIEGMMKMKDSYNVSMLTQKLALASLRDADYFSECVRKIRETRAFTAEGLRKLDFRLTESETNFLFACPPDGDGEAYFKGLRKENVIVRYFPGPVTGKYVRMTMGTREEMERVLDLTEKMLKR